MSSLIYIATRKSPLALWQAKTTQQLILHHQLKSELLTVVTTGDKIQHTQLASVVLEGNQPHHLTTGKGLFIKEIQEALLSKKAHIAVHSMKDLPVEQTPGLVVGALLPRASPCDVLILSPQVLEGIGCKNKKINEIDFTTLKSMLLNSELFFSKPIGTTSARRQLLMKKLFSSTLDLQILRGNVDSRLKKVNNNEFSAILLAQAGLDRLEIFQPESMFSLPVDLFIPASAQGIIAIECSEDNKDLLNVLAKINCKKTCLQAAIERMVLSFLEGDCNSAVGSHYSEQKINVLYGKNGVEKECRIAVSLNDLNELEKLLEKSGGIFSSFFVNIFKTEFALKVKSELFAVMRL